MTTCFWKNHVLQEEDSCYLPGNKPYAAYAAYALGGISIGAVDTVDGLTFADETAFVFAATLPLAGYAAAGANSNTRGYTLGGGGAYGGVTSEIQGIEFSSGTSVNPAAVLSVNRDAAAGANSSSSGYAMGGLHLATRVNEIDGLEFTGETAINPAATLSSARSAAAGVNSSTRGYALGGYNTTADPTRDKTVVDGIEFAGETAINPAATLAVARRAAAGVNSSAKGYAFGGYNIYLAGDYAEIDGIEFAGETAVNPAATLSVARTKSAGANSGVRGYAMGGLSGAGPYTQYSLIDGIEFASESAVTPSATLSVARYHPTGVQWGFV